MKELIKGANAPLAASGRVQIRLLWRTAPGEIDFACFALDGHDRVLADDWFVFYNQPASPGDAIRIDPDRPAFLINLDALPGAVRKCIFTATLGSGNFQAPTAGDYAVRFRLTEPIESRSLLVAELYRYDGAWKVRAKGEGLKTDLAGLSRLFGVDVLDETPSLRHPPAAPPPLTVSRPATPPPLPPSRVLPTAPVPLPTAPPPDVPVPAAPPSMSPGLITGQPTPPALDRHEKLKTYATLAIAVGSLTTAMTTLIALLVTQCHR